MSRLLKYEFRKTWIAKLVLLGMTAVAEAAFLVSLLGPDTTSMNRIGSVAVFLLVMLAFGSFLVIGIQSVLTLHRDMNTKQGYMLFMTPRNSYQILGAKMLENGISLVVTWGFFFGLGMLDITLLLSKYGQIEQLWTMIRQMMSAMRTELELSRTSVMALTLALVASWLATVSTAYLADIISSALLNGKKFNGLLTFVLFIALSAVLNWLEQLVNAGAVGGMVAMLWWQVGIAMAFAAVTYLVSAWIMDHHLSV